MSYERCSSIQNRDCVKRRVNGDYMCATCRKQYDDYLYHRDLDRKEMLSGEWQGHAYEPSIRTGGGGLGRHGDGASPTDYGRGED